MNIKNILFIVLGFVVVIMALPNVFALSLPVTVDIELKQMYMCEHTDPWGNKGVIVPFTIKNNGNIEIEYPRVDFFVDGFHEGLIQYTSLTLLPGGEFSDINGIFFQYDGYHINKTFNVKYVVDWENKLNEGDEKNNEKEAKVFVKEGLYVECNDLNLTPPINITTNDTINDTKDFHSRLLIEHDIGNYKYVNSQRHNEDYGTRVQANYERGKNYAAAAVIAFKNNEKAREYLKTKIKNANELGYDVKFVNKNGVHLIRGKNENTFIWVHGTYAISVSEYSNETPWALLLAYLKKYPSEPIKEIKEIATDLNANKYYSKI